MSLTHALRRERLTTLLAAHEADAILVTHGVNVRYLTGLDSSNAAVLVRADTAATLATDSRYFETARRVCSGIEVIEERDVAGALATLAGRVAVEADHMPVADYFRLGGDLPRLSGLVESVRQIKDEAEIDLIRTACELTDRAFAEVLPELRPGLTEKEVARALERRMVESGADGLAFESIVASGPNGAIPHHSPSDRPLERGDLVTMDFGALYRGYHADMTRTVAIGEPAGWQRELYDLVRASQRAGRRAVRIGAAFHEVDAAARDLIAEAGYGEFFKHGLGHGVGLEIHELPFLSPRKPEPDHEHARIEDRVPVTVEPGVYLPGKGGVRIEDTLVARDGGPELLTRTTKELLVL
ncbi:aminopeptidase P family protein [Streptosporangium sp. NBC_01755]|uniref:M24 family metallopeptidase n=1 Tax=unclassified Streptosporangium TaxID=2632669 RepID=UPI002DD81790|nr:MULTISPECIES: aminopeptidase P family protein [unclassified Streptosporangium]WSA22863.1 aminopeptidase P family protein [Streptosporangium sp. NBC_01810]WSC98992.1 aminopeptidase P family protein [Streptosporangium sp. NBC_01755]